MTGQREGRGGRRGASRRAGLDAERFDEAWERVNERGRAAGRDRMQQLRIKSVLAVQAGLAAALAWAVARWLTGMPSPIFAPAAAVAVITSSFGRRLSNTVELLAGVTLGIIVSDLLIGAVGAGVWQTGVIVAASVLVALALSTRGGIVGNASGTAVLLGALSSSRHTLEFPRFVDALIGGGVGLVVTLLLVPINPLRVVRRVAAPTLRRRDHDLADQALSRSQAIGADLGRFWDVFGGAKETVDLAPARWPRRRSVRHYQLGAPDVDQAVWNTRVLARRAVVLIEDGEPIPESLPDAVEALGAAVNAVQEEVLADQGPEDARRHALRAVAAATRAELAGTGLSGTVIVGQVRTAASDVLQATGMDREEALRRIREVAAAQS
ncbi:FUSC family protein [Micromonospora tulbaghiae]|uniref:FUSC family protein n=1 Tax=Micromonospora tulbaghiae TaxID=479978 RepID=UPI0033DDF6D3